jgi:hypothetical protein
MTVKKSETREKYFDKAVNLLVANKKLGMK